MPSDDIARLYDYTAGTTIQSDQVDQELNLLVTTCNGKAGRGVDNTFSGANTFSGNNTFTGTDTFTGSNTFSHASAPIKTDKILENTSDTGVTIDGLLIKDGGIPSLIPAGITMDYVGSSAPTGWVLAAGKTIGNASSSGTERANADTETLFTLLWNSMADAEAPVSSGRGANAAADYAANKTITLPDLRGRATVGLDNLGGSAANRITSASTNGANATTLGKSGGAQTHTLASSELPNPITSGAWTVAAGAGSNATVIQSGSTTGSGVISNSGGGGAHSNTQPWMALTKIIKL